MRYLITGATPAYRKQVANWLHRHHLFRVCNRTEISKTGGLCPWDARLVCIDSGVSDSRFRVVRIPWSCELSFSDESKFYHELDKTVREHEWNELHSY